MAEQHPNSEHRRWRGSTRAKAGKRLLGKCEDSVQQIATAYGILTDKANVAAGRPTGIVGKSPDERDAEIERLLQEEAAKRTLEP